MLSLILSKPKPKDEKKPEEQPKEARKTKRAITAASASFLALGIVGLAVFGYLLFTNGGFSTLVGMADGIGLLISLVVLLAGVYMK